MQNKKIFLVIIWLISIAFYMYTRMMNTSLSAFSIPLISEFHFNNIDITWAIAMYSLAMLMMKIPVGILVDRYGIDMPLIFAMSMVLAGTILFAFPLNTSLLLLSRFMMGVGTAFAMMSVYKLTSIVLSKRLFAIVTGFIYCFGSLAVSMSGLPLNQAVESYVYSSIVMFLAVILAVILVIYLLARLAHGKIPQSGDIRSFRDYFTGFKTVFKERQILFTILYSSFFTCVFFNTIGYWGNNILIHTKLPNADEAGLIGNSIASIASGVASIAVGFMISTQYLKTRHIALFSTLANIAVVIIFYTNITNIYTLSIASLLFGLGFGYTGIAFDTANKCNQTYLVSILSILFLIEYILNSIVNPLAAFIQKTLINLDFSTFASYQIAYGVFFALLIFANILSFYIKAQKV